MNDALSVVLKAVQRRPDQPLLIAIDGRCAAGKTTLAAELQRALDCNVIHMDDFFLQPHQRTESRLRQPGENVDHERFLAEVMLPLKAGVPVSYRKFRCKTMDFSADIPLEPRKITVVEGAYSCHPNLWDNYDLRFFYTIDPEEQLRRIAQRNGEEALPMFRERWIPLEEAYFAEYRIMERCDHILK